MRLSAFARMHVVQKEEKESKLKDFIGRDIAARKAAGGTAQPVVYRLLALSAESPAAKAIAQFAEEAESLGITIQAIFFRKGTATGQPGASDPVIPASACRYVSDKRLLDAHEQLVLGDATTWLGDCMRREPSKRDAFESYSETCEATARRAIRAFEHFWITAKPASLSAANRRSATAIGQEVLDPSVIAGADLELSAVALRH
ncbi:MAG: hypothetical protein WC807_02455 [Hyphomicrobium sp.]|jgi:hypothetical protein